MNRPALYFLTGFFILAASCVSHQAKAEILLTDDFSYPSGTLTTRPGSPWVAHSNAGDTPVQVTTAGAVRIQALGSREDVSAPLAGWPNLTNSPKVLYAAFKLRYNGIGVLPDLAGDYIAHFRDINFVYPCRVWATTNGSPLGQYRVGISNGENFDGAINTIFPLSLSTGVTYQIVVRLSTSSNVSTLWVNPSSEFDPGITATNENFAPNLALTIGHFAFRQGGGGGNNAGTCIVDELRVGDNFSEANGTNHPPVISQIYDQAIPPNGSTASLGFTVGDFENPATGLSVVAVSLEESIVANSGLVLSGNGTNRTIMVTPLAGKQGMARIKILVTDLDGVATASVFNVAVGVPSISCLVNQIIPTNTSTGPLSFRVGHSQLPAGSLLVTASSSDTNLIPNENITLAGAGAVRTVNLTPNQDAAGIATIVVSVSAGNVTASNSFTVTVGPLLGLLLSESFDYPDGTQLSGGSTPWYHTGGATGQVSVASGAIQLSDNNTESVSRSLNLPQSFQSISNGLVLFASFRIKVIERPPNTGNRDGFFSLGGRCGLYVLRDNAPTGFIRFGVTENSSDPSYTTPFPTLVPLNADSTIVVRYNLATEGSTLWLNPISDLSPSIDAVHGYVAPKSVNAVDLRQNSATGEVIIDDIKVGTAFYDVMPNLSDTSPELVIIPRCDGGVQLKWQGDLSGYTLERLSGLSGDWQTNTNQGVTNGQHKSVVIYPDVPQEFFRLVK